MALTLEDLKYGLCRTIWELTVQPLFVEIQGNIFLSVVAHCEGCHRNFDMLIDMSRPPVTDLRRCPNCHPDFPAFEAEVEIGCLGGPVLVSMMVTDARKSKLFRLE
jgi:hypothetical protein